MTDNSQPKQIPNNAGNINERLLRRFSENNLGRIESAHIKSTIELYSPEAKRYFMRMFYPMQSSVHYITTIARMHLADQVVEKVEQDLRTMLKTVSSTIDAGTARIEKKLTKAGITRLAEYHVPPVQQEVLVFSTFGKQYLDIISRFDHLMLMSETLVVVDEIDFTELKALKVEFKKPVRSVAKAARLARNRLYQLARSGGLHMADGDFDDGDGDGDGDDGARRIDGADTLATSDAAQQGAGEPAPHDGQPDGDARPAGSALAD